jgi:hypothetical protein
MRNSPTVTFQQLNRAAGDVRKELQSLEIYTEDGLGVVDVYWCTFPVITLPAALGFFMHFSSWLDKRLGYEPGHIYVPRWVLTHGFWCNRGSIRDVLRHEYAHGLAHYYPNITDDRRFERAFGGGYWDAALGSDLPDEDFISRYAMTMPMEDFAETFMTYLRRKGILPQSMQSSKAFVRKWKFIEWCIKQIANEKISARPIC